MPKSRSASLLCAGVVAVLLDGCGGGGGSAGGTAAPSPTPTPTVTPAPTPTPTSASAFDDAEFRASPWLAADNALPAFDGGGTGNGVTLAIIDDGVDPNSPEFAGRLVLGTANQGSAAHGTAVASIAAAARNGAGVMGVAYRATVLSYNAEGCSPTCFILIDNMAAAVDDAVSRGARVINLSVVGDFSREPLFSALERATNAGVIVVIGAGNDGGANPNGFALQNAQFVDSKLLIIAGAHADNRQLSAISSRAGTGAEWYLAAYGPGATSSSTPVISGTVALLAASFPSLSASQIVDVLYASADDAGAPGVDAVFGHGILNIGRAFTQARTLAGP